MNPPLWLPPKLCIAVFKVCGKHTDFVSVSKNPFENYPGFPTMRPSGEYVYFWYFGIIDSKPFKGCMCHIKSIIALFHFGFGKLYCTRINAVPNKSVNWWTPRKILFAAYQTIKIFPLTYSSAASLSMHSDSQPSITKTSARIGLFGLRKEYTDCWIGMENVFKTKIIEKDITMIRNSL